VGGGIDCTGMARDKDQNGDELSGSTKRWEVLERLHNRWPLEECSVPWN
jgi:hypothetical protein